jgi:hypothetical protein
MACLVMLAGLVVSPAASTDAQETQAATGNRLERLPQDLEIQLALSALPLHLRDKATVYVLNSTKGFEVAREGTGGFYALVARTGDDSFRGAWALTEYRDDVLYPIAFDEAGAQAQMRVFLDAAAMQAKGTRSAELKRIIQKRHETGYYRAPERAGISYMLSPVLRTYVDPDRNEGVTTSSYPHVMYYAPGVSADDIGAGDVGGVHPFVILHGHHGYMIQALGVTERAAITREYEEMLARLCGIRDDWCLPDATGEERNR